jgi:hypothetical protein
MGVSMTDAPKITDEEVRRVFAALSGMKPEDIEEDAYLFCSTVTDNIKRALSAFLSARVPTSVPADNAEYFAGFNACRNIMLDGKGGR